MPSHEWLFSSGQKKSVFTKARSAHEASPALTLQAGFQKLVSCGNDIRGMTGALLYQHPAYTTSAAQDTAAEVRHAAGALLAEVGFPLSLIVLRGKNTVCMGVCECVVCVSVCGCVPWCVWVCLGVPIFG